MWKAETLNSTVTAEVNSLSVDMLARLRRIVELIQTHGLERMHEPHVKHLEGRLWEIRLIGRDEIARALYITAIERRVRPSTRTLERFAAATGMRLQISFEPAPAAIP